MAEGIIRLLGKKYTSDILKSLDRGPKRFKAISDACEGQKMRAQRLRELKSLELIRIRAKRVNGRAVSIYSISEKGKRALQLAESLKKLEDGKSKQI
jgi:DNA-binding HxlR family transcriptional regulator